MATKVLLSLPAFLGVAAAAECSLAQCIWRGDDYMFGDALFGFSPDIYRQGYSEEIKPGGLYNHLQPSLCSAENWRVYDNCLLKCPLALVPTFPSNMSMRACLAEVFAQEYTPETHIDSTHPLNGKEVEVIIMGTPGNTDREGCTKPIDRFWRDYNGKIVIVNQGGCFVGEKTLTAESLGAIAVIEVTMVAENSIVPFARVQLGASVHTGRIPTFTLRKELGTLITSQLDNGVPMRAKIDLDCSVMDDPPPPLPEAPTDCPSELALGMCGDMPNVEQQLCSNCATHMDIVGTPHSPCLYGHRLLPRETKNSFEIGMEGVVHLADLIPEYKPDPNCADNDDFRDAITGLSCKQLKSILDSRPEANCGQLSFAFPPPSVIGFYTNCRISCPRSQGGLGCPGGTGEGCEVADFKNARGKNVAVEVTESCAAVEVVLNAAAAGVNALIFLPKEDGGPFLVEGLSKFVPIPVHALDGLGGRDLKSKIIEANKADSTVTGVSIRISRTSHTPSEPPPVKTPAPEPETGLALESSRELEFTPPMIVATICIILFAAANVFVIIRQHFHGVEISTGGVDGKQDAARGLKVPLSAASTMLSLSLLFTIAVVAFVLTYIAGKDTTDSALEDGWSAVEKTHSNAVTTVSQLKDQLMANIVARVGQGIASGLREGQLQAMTGAKLFMNWDGDWNDFSKRLWQVSELSTLSGETRWKLAIRTYNGFYATEVLQTDDRPSDIRGYGVPDSVAVTNNGFQYRINTVVYNPSTTERTVTNAPSSREHWEPDENLGRSWMNAAKRMRGEDKGSVVCSTVQQTTPVGSTVFREYGLRPLSCLAGIYNLAGDFVGTAQAHTSLEWFGGLLGQESRSKETANMMVVVFNEFGEFVTSSKGRNARKIESYGAAYKYHANVSDSITAPMVLEYSQEPYLNAAANYMKGAMNLGTPGQTTFDFQALRTSAGGGEFDQAEWYGRGLWTRHIAFSLASVGGQIRDVSEEGWRAAVEGDHSFVEGARGGVGLELKGGLVKVFLNLSIDTPRVKAQRDPSSDSYSPSYNRTLTIGSEEVVAFTAVHIYYGTRTTPMLREPLVTSTFSLSMWVRPNSVVSDSVKALSSTPQLFSDSEQLTWVFRLYANGRMMLSQIDAELMHGCATRPIKGGPTVGKWTHITVVVDRNYLPTDAFNAGQSVRGVQTCRTYVDGELHDSVPISTGMLDFDNIPPNRDPYRIGENFDGALDEVTMYNTTLSQGDVRSIMDKGPLAYDKEVPSRRWFLQVREESHFSLSWGLAALIPRSDIMSQVDLLNELQRKNQSVLRGNTEQKLDQSTWEVVLVIAAIAMASTLVFLIFNELLTRPFALLACQMMEVAVMNVEELKVGAGSVLAEIDSMHNAMTLMVRNLRFFRDFMPQSAYVGLVPEQASDPSSPPVSDIGSVASLRRRMSAGRQMKQDCDASSASSDTFGSQSATSTKGSVASGVPTAHTGRRKSLRQVPGVADALMTEKKVSLLMINIRGWMGIGKLSSLSAFQKFNQSYATLVCEASRPTRGVAESLRGDRILISFNGALNNARHAQGASDCALRVCKFGGGTKNTGRVSCGISSSKCLVGPSGANGLRVYDFVGTASMVVHACERAATWFGLTAVTDDPVCIDNSHAFNSRFLFKATSGAGRHGWKTSLWHLASEKAEQANDEWMYQLEKQADPYNANNGVALALYEGNKQAALEALKHRGDAESDDDIATLREVIDAGLDISSLTFPFSAAGGFPPVAPLAPSIMGRQTTTLMTAMSDEEQFPRATEGEEVVRVPMGGSDDGTPSTPLRL
eukprot:Hpha_TRINITY_DN16512_c0_g2::TRINITY_DN16512_c0_g2_i1::g.134676::m.134676